MHILTIVGARPQFVKAAIVSKALSSTGIRETLIHTGQHYDHNMSTVFFEELGIPSPSVNLKIGSGSHGQQTGSIMIQLEKYIQESTTAINALLVYGDTNSTLAGALVASKLHIPVIHIEAGLRSFNKKMPEEVNRIMTDHVSDLLFCPSQSAINNLADEGITNGVFNVGDVMYDAVKTFSELAKKNVQLHDLVPFRSEEFSLVTIHRPSNTDSPEKLQHILNGLSKIDHPVVWPVHPRNSSRLQDVTIPDNLILIEPVPYMSMLTLLEHSSMVFTDSGGLQKEAYWLKKPCITLREQTEWIETLEGGWNQLVGSNTELIVKAATQKPKTDWKPLYGESDASDKISNHLLQFLSSIKS